jgi:hypothetical protein
MIPRDKYLLRQYLVDEPDPELRRIRYLIKHRNRPPRHPEFMNQKSIVLYLNRKGGTAPVMHENLVATLGEEAILYNTVRKYLREAKISPGDPTAFLDTISAHIDD